MKPTLLLRLRNVARRLLDAGRYQPNMHHQHLKSATFNWVFLPMFVLATVSLITLYFVA